MLVPFHEIIHEQTTITHTCTYKYKTVYIHNNEYNFIYIYIIFYILIIYVFLKVSSSKVIFYNQSSVFKTVPHAVILCLNWPRHNWKIHNFYINILC